MEKARHILLLREKLLEQDPSLELSKLNKEASNKIKQAQNKEKELSDRENIDDDGNIIENAVEKVENHEKNNCNPEVDLMSKCLELMARSRLRPPATVNPPLPVKLLFHALFTVS